MTVAENLMINEEIMDRQENQVGSDSLLDELQSSFGRAVVEQVSQTVIQMDGTTQQNAALVEEASAAARSLEQQANRLIDAVDVFDLSTTAAAKDALARAA